ncbi:MAG: glycosyltransferase, partial [Planctomycetales bacterium]|nr:glycosyltransferase [Planctomycetales bacterium]
PLESLPLSDSHRPLVSVIIAARNEEARIAQTIRQLAAQTDVSLELIVVDDRSTDRTAEIVRSCVPNCRVPIRLVQITELPQRWLGKCHACWTGAQLAQGSWLLFTDGDIHMRPDVVARSVQQCARESADHLALIPNLVVSRWIPRVAVVAHCVMFTLYTSPELINKDRGKQGIGVGAFNLIRRSAYDRIGGHEALRMEVVDDVKLGVLVLKHGMRQRAYSGLSDIQADWARTLPEMIRAVEKNWFAAVEYRLSKAIGIFLLLPGSIFAALVGPWYAGWIGCFPLAACLSTGFAGMIYARRFGWPWHTGVCSIAGWLVFVGGGMNSVWATYRQGGIRWRDSFYPLEQLRAGVVR